MAPPSRRRSTWQSKNLLQMTGEGQIFETPSGDNGVAKPLSCSTDHSRKHAAVFN
jgi:hypothetical protein